MSIHRVGVGRRVKRRENGRQRSRNFSRKGDADAWDREVKRRHQLGPLAVQQLTDRGPTLGEWITERWATEHGVTLARRTRDCYASCYAVHIGPWLDDVPIRDLTVGRLRAWQADRIAHGASTETIRKSRTFLSSVLRHAAEAEAITGNPLTFVRAPHAEHSDEVVALAPLTVEAIRSMRSTLVPGQRTAPRCRVGAGGRHRRDLRRFGRAARRRWPPHRRTRLGPASSLTA